MTTEKKDRCSWCNQEAPSYNAVLIPGETRDLLICLHCYNQEISKAVGIEYDQIQLHPVTLKDRDNIDHEFHFSLRLMGDAQVLKAFEMKGDLPTGYEFIMTGNTEDGIFSLFSHLYTQMLNALSRKHIFKDPKTDDWQITRANTLRGKLVSAEGSTGSPATPSTIIDGKKIGWDELGRMLMSHDGANFKLQIMDNSIDPNKGND